MRAGAPETLAAGSRHCNRDASRLTRASREPASTFACLAADSNRRKSSHSAFRTPRSAFKMRLGCYEGFSADAAAGNAFGSLVGDRLLRPRRLSAKA